MLARERQKVFVDNAIRCLNKYKRTLGIASTGAGKTIMLSFVIKHYLESNKNFKTCVLAHRDELTSQNEEKFKLVSSSTPTSIFNAEQKDWSGDVTFAMVQTLSKDSNLNTIPKIDLLVIDEAHHSTSVSYQKIIDKIIELNNQVLIFGVTATPVRSDKALLRKVFGSVCDTIRLGELIASGHLVAPKTHIIDVGISEEILKLNTRNKDEYNMDKVEQLMNTSVINDKVVMEWLDKSRDRKTVIFCSTVAHASSVVDTFLKHQIKAALITGELSAQDRKLIFNKLDTDEIQIIVNVAVLTEGWDYQPISSVILLRPCSFKGTMIQMIGRGLRTVDYSLYPNVQKNDCLVLDFGASIITHGSLEQDINFAQEGIQQSKEKEKDCPQCQAKVPYGVYECDLCGYTFEKKEKKEKEDISEFAMKEIDLLTKSNFKWTSLNNDTLHIAAGFYVSSIITYKNDNYFAIGINEKNKQITILHKGDKKQVIMVANDFLNKNETDESCNSSRKWQKSLATVKQREYLPSDCKNDMNIDRYTAACLLKLKFNISSLRKLGVV